MKYKIGDKVRIKSLDWYNENKGHTNSIWCENGEAWFFYHMSQYCGKIMTIKNVWEHSYTLEGSDSRWTDEMIEGLVEEETPKFKIHDKVKTVDGFTGIILNIGYDNNIHCFRYHVSCILNREWYNESQLKLYDSKENEFNLPDSYIFKDENGNVINAMKIVLEKKNVLEKKSPKTDDIIKWLREHDMTKYIGVIYSGMCSITFDTEKLIKDITEMIGDE